MTKTELKPILDQEGFLASRYSLSGGDPDDAICLTFEGGSWRVYYSERGNRDGLVSFDTEFEACEYLLNELRSLPEWQVKNVPRRGEGSR